MGRSELAGKPAPRELLENIPRLVTLYYANRPDPADPAQRVAFGTSGHRGSSLKSSFNEAHILATTQAICDWRKGQGINGPLFVGVDTHALSEPAFASALEVLAANGVTAMIQQGGGYTPTPVISHAILTYNRGRKDGLADGIVITPSHNPPADGGFKYNPPHGGPADTAVTRSIETRANELMAAGLNGVRRIGYEKARASGMVKEHDYVAPYVDDLANVIDMPAIAAAGLRIGADPMGGSGLAYWDVIAERHKLNIEVVNRAFDPTFSFMTVDGDGKIRMDCSSPFAMASLIALKDRFDIAFGNDPDFDRHGIVTRSAGILNPNHYLSVCVDYLFGGARPGWPKGAAVGKTTVSSSMIDRVTASHGRKLYETPVGFKWFVEGLQTGALGFGGEESSGASFLRMDGAVWSTDKDGIILNLLAAEMLAKTGKDAGQRYRELTAIHGDPVYRREDAPANAAQKKALSNLTPDAVTAKELAGEPITAILTRAPGDNAPIGGLKVMTQNHWFAARPSGTEDVYKIYMESFKGEAALAQVAQQARAIVAAAFAA